MPEPTGAPRPTAFDWRIYADATLAGLSALLPLPLVDLMFEAYFRRRMPGAIARARARPLAEGAGGRLGRGDGRSLSLVGCLALPLLVVRYVVKKLWRKVVYVFAIADAASQVSAYWHRAYLLDHLVRAGHLAPEVDWPRAARVFEAVLRETDTGPLVGLARQTVASTHRVLRLLVRAKRHGAADQADSLTAILRSHWDAAEASLLRVAVRYNEAYLRSLELDPPVVATRPDAPYCAPEEAP
ncbi:MAG: hypothetical protein MUC56_18065 [Thermoanaerobaculales bacterium]|jgi:hypothetical protein|nr:hypothetical protein [Thermoanaerobaculales bacterium]